MSLKSLLGLENTSLTDTQIMAKIQEAKDKGQEEVEFMTKDGKKVIVKIPHVDFSKYVDPWDGTGAGKNKYPEI